MKKLALLLVSFTLLIVQQTYSQPFESISSGITGVGRSYMAWGDYDNDGDLDVAVCGITTGGDHVTKLYENTEGSFTEIQANFIGVKDGSLDWGDFDNDGDLDLLITGETFDAGNISLIYRNSMGSFELYDAGFPPVAYGHGIWGDYDNDGDLDVLITGNWEVKIYNNESGVFTLDDQDLGHLQSSRAAWGDFDNDGDLDLLFIGDTGSGYATLVYINDGGVYSLLDLEMEGLFSGSCDWVDFDKDGDMDICVTGYDIFFEPGFFIYENLGDGSVAEYPAYLPGIGVSFVDWGDYDNDGDLDILSGGKNASCGGGITNVYYNEDGIFLPAPQTTIDGSVRSCGAWADYDNDGDLDFLLTGLTPEEIPFTKLYRNAAGDNTYALNEGPMAPANLQSVVDSNTVVLTWDKTTDDNTPQDGLNYNLRIGTSPGAGDIFAPMSDETGGRRYVQAIGNTNSNASWTITNLPEGTYYWSVQAIDQAYVGSEFAGEQSFTIVITDIDEISSDNELTIYPNPARNYIILESPKNNVVEYKIFNMNGQEMMNGITNGEKVEIQSLKAGVYFFYLNNHDENQILRFIKE